MKTLKILIADDHDVVREGLTAKLRFEEGIEIIDQASDGQEVLEKLDAGPLPDLAILDINMPRKNGMAVTAEIKQTYPDVKVLILSMHNRSEFIAKLRKIGVDGYVLKSSSGELMSAIRAIAEGKTYFCSGVKETVFETNSDVAISPSNLSEREKDVIRLIAKGFSGQQAADHLNLTKHTIDSHRKRILAKLQLKNSVELTRYALRTGIVEGFDIS